MEFEWHFSLSLHIVEFFTFLFPVQLRIATLSAVFCPLSALSVYNKIFIGTGLAVVSSCLILEKFHKEG